MKIPGSTLGLVGQMVNTPLRRCARTFLRSTTSIDRFFSNAPGRSLAVVALLPVLSGLGGCSSIAGDACVGPDTTASTAVLDRKEAEPRNCDGNFMSARNQRGVLYTGEDKPRLWTGEAARAVADIDPSSLNVAVPNDRAQPRVTGYLGAQRIDYVPDAAVTATDVADLHSAGGDRVDPNERVSVNFKKATVDYVLKQLLGGVLGLNYVAPDDLGGSITFRTEQPVPKGQLLQIVRDLLARNGLEMRKIDGVYQIGSHDLLASIETGANQGRAGDRVTRIVHLKKPNAAVVLGLARQLLPGDVALGTTNAPDTLLLGAAPNDIDGAQAILKTIEASGIGDDKTVIISLKQGSPERIATQLSEFYRGRGIEGLTVMPLDRQQAILVASKDATTLRGVQQLARAMDNDVRDEVSLRIVPLKYLRATDAAQRLSTLFGASGGGGADGRGAGGSALGSGGNGLRAPAASAASLNGGLGDAGAGGPGTSYLPSPAAGDLAPAGIAPQGSVVDGGGGAAPRSAAGGAGRGASASPSGGGAGETKIVADPGSNSVMVNSSYALFKRIREVLTVLDVPQSQVVIEATIVEVTLNDQLQRGVQVFLSGNGITVGSGDVGNPLGATSTSTAGTGTAASAATAVTNTTGTANTVASTVGTAGTASNGFSANTGGIISVGANLGHGYAANAVIAALQGITKVKVISSPYLTVTNGKEARLVVGDQIPYSTRTQSANNLGNTTTTNEVTVKDTGIVLDITPEIHANDEVELKISQSVSTPNASSPLGGTLTPVISTRSVDSDVLLQSGHTVLLGGLIQDRLEQSEGGVPVLMTTPVIGDLFKSKSDAVLRTELVLLLTPRVTRTTSQIENVAHLLQAQIHTR